MFSDSYFNKYEKLVLGGIVLEKLPLTMTELFNLLKNGNYNLIQAGKISLK